MKQLHLSIGIPVYNEEANILNLLSSLLSQKQVVYILDRILVVCDGSTDNTVSVVKQFAKKHTIVGCVYDGKRIGVRARIQQILQANTSDVVMLFDGDTLPENATTVNTLMKEFVGTSVQLSTAALIPVVPVTVFEYLLSCWRSLWTRLTHTWKNGNNIYNFRGVGLAVRKSLAKKIRIPDTITGASSHFMYLTAKKLGHLTSFCSGAVIHYRLASSLSDYSKQLNRGSADASIIKSLFSPLYKSEYSIPRSVRYSALIKSVIYTPISAILGIAFQILLPAFHRSTRPSDKNGLWEAATSTKSLHTQGVSK